MFSSYFKILNRHYLFKMNKKKRWIHNENRPSICIVGIHVKFSPWEWIPDVNYFHTVWRLESISSLRHCCFLKLILMDLAFHNKKQKHFNDLKNLICCSFNLGIAWSLGYMFLTVDFYFMFCIQVELANSMFKSFRREACCISQSPEKKADFSTFMPSVRLHSGRSL